MSSEQNLTQKKTNRKQVAPALPMIEQAAVESADEQAALNGVMRKAQQAPIQLSSKDAARLQRSLGNRVTGALLGRGNSAESTQDASQRSLAAIHRRIINLGVQAKLTVGPVDDPYEKEADAVAKQVVQRINRQEDDDEIGLKRLQRQEDEEELGLKRIMRQEEDEELAMKRISRQDDEEELGLKRIMRQEEDDELAMQRIQRDAAPGDPMLDGGDVNSDIEAGIRGAKGGGSPLSDTIRKPMENAFNANFSDVKVHTDNQSDALNQSVSARAFTTGKDIFFRSGQYDPGSSSGQELIAHELTHVVQQGGVAQRSSESDSIARMPSNYLQRLPSRRDMETIAGKPSKRAIKNHSTYIQILEALDAFKEAEEKARPGNLTPGIKRGLLDPIITLSQNWLDNHEASSRRGVFIQGLKSDAQAAKHSGTSDLETSPSDLAEQLEGRREGATVPDFEREGGSVPDTYRFTVAAAVEHPDFLKFATARFKLKMASGRKYKKMKSGEQKREAARRVLFDKFKKRNKRKMNEEEKASEDFKKDVDKLANAGVGHTWVKFVALKEGKVQQMHSFGFYPLVPVSKPTVAVPGVVVHPDNRHEDEEGEDRRYKDTIIDQEKYNRGIGKAVTVLNSPPDYTMWDYNCTRFARDIALEVGAPFPGTYKTIPRLGKSFLKAYSPNNTFETMEGDEDSYTESKELADIREVEEEKERVEEEGKRAEQKIYELQDTNPHTLQTDLEVSDFADDYHETYTSGTDIWVWGMDSDYETGKAKLSTEDDPDYYAPPDALLAALGIEF